MLPNDFDGVIIIGKRKKGKSTLLRQLLYGEPRVIAYDAKGDLREPTKIYCGYVPAFPQTGLYRAMIVTEGRLAKELEWSAYCARSLGHCIYVVDELADALGGKEPLDNFEWTTRMGRKRDVRFIYTFQRPTEVPRMCTANASDWFLHQSNEPTDVKYVKDACGAEAANEMRTLQRGQSVHVRDGQVVGIMESENPNP